MKRIVPILLMLAVCVDVSSKEFPRNIVSVKAGFNTAWMTSCGVNTSSVPSFMIGVTDQVLLSAAQPFYFETGLMIQGKGYAIKGYEDSSTNMYTLQIPLNINYQIYVADKVRLEPSLGLYYALGLDGNRVMGSNKVNVYKDGSLSRHELGWACGLGCSISRFTFGLSYDMGINTIDLKDTVYGDESLKLGYRDIRSHIFSVRLGVNF